MAVLYIVATPIGNLQDITFRAVETLKRVDLILCEDTRVTQKLLSHYEIKTPILSYHQHSKLNKVEYILNLLKQGKNLALVSDAGTPGISDPGNKLIAEFTQAQPVPGPSALTAAASIAGFPMDRFLFLGFPPLKNKRKRFFEEVANSKYAVIFYESPYRIIKTLKEIEPLRDVVVGRELTKKFETIYRGKVEDVLNQLTKPEIRGEFVVIVNKRI